MKPNLLLWTEFRDLTDIIGHENHAVILFHLEINGIKLMVPIINEDLNLEEYGYEGIQDTLMMVARAFGRGLKKEMNK